MKTTKDDNLAGIVEAVEDNCNFIFISYSPSKGVHIRNSIGDYAFTMLGALELAKKQLMDEFRDAADEQQSV